MYKREIPVNGSKIANKNTRPARSSAQPSNERQSRPATPSSKPVDDGQQTTVAAEAKQKLVRDSFTIPKGEYAVLGDLKERATQLKRPTKKSELLRAGVAALHGMSDKAFLAALAKVPSLKTGRPKDESAAG